MLYTKEMTTVPAAPHDVPRKISRSRNFTISLLHGLAFGLCLKFSGNYLSGRDEPDWFRYTVLALPWVLLAASIPFMRRIWPKDELEKIIDRDALAFTCYGFVLVLILFSQLQSAGMLENFKWDTGYLLLLLMLLMGAGMFWSSRRYR